MATNTLRPVGLRSRGKALWVELTADGGLNVPALLVAGEAARLADRLDDLDGVVNGRRSGLRSGDMTAAAAMAEARLQSAALSRLLLQMAELAGAGAASPKAPGADVDGGSDETPKGGPSIDELAVARAGRGRPTSDPAHPAGG